MNISILVCTHGDPDWSSRARARAIPSAQAEEPYELIVVHLEGGTLAQARNRAAARASGDWLCFLDADDELQPGYLAAIRSHADLHACEFRVERPGWTLCGQPSVGARRSGRHGHRNRAFAVCELHTGRPRGRSRFERDARLFVPSVSYLMAGAASAPAIPNQGRWPELNECVIGTLVPAALFRAVGGFREFDAYEDWDLFLRCTKAGATLAYVPEAVYLAHVRGGSRNEASRADVYAQIWAEYVTS